ncbi:hypothetical protein BS639_08760 [Rouxiella silvae]|uniref:DNA-binding protein n=1 Tax=Rouxiella silvae TaxID=1646373 RepID=A0ABX3U2F1_9GAMM|nr:hypothetical protein BS639_08760 [Rouxiella silvae]
MTRTPNLRVNEKTLAKMLKVKAAEIFHAEKTGRKFRGLILPIKNSRGYRIGEVMDFIDKLNLLKQF